MTTPEVLTIPGELDAMTNELDRRIETLAYGNEDIRNAALFATKYIFDFSLETERGSQLLIDELLSSLNPLQKPQTRSQSKADRPVLRASASKTFKTTPISSLFVENMDTEQVWMQLDLRAQMICDLLDFALETGKSEGAESFGEEMEDDEEDDHSRKVMEAIENGEEIELDALEEEFGEEDATDDESEDGSNDLDDLANEGEDVIHLQPSDEDHSDSNARDTLFDVIKSSARSKKKGSAYGLNDDFFNLDAFHAETYQAEAKSSSRGQLTEDKDTPEDENMSVDLFTSLGGEAEAQDAADIFYRDFFEAQNNTSSQLCPPVKGQSGSGGRVRFHDEVRVKKIKAKGKNLPLSFLYGNGMDDEDDDEDEDNDEDEDDMEKENGDLSIGSGSEDESTDFRDDDGGFTDEDGDEEEEEEDEEEDEEDEERDDAMSQNLGSEDNNMAVVERLKDDLFADADDDHTSVDVTMHERRQAALREQIAQLEAENVAQKEWTLMGEADSRSRPQNSLLEEDLEFERVIKPIPVISEEIVQGLEQRIKARILENWFDDVIRIRPPEDKPFLPSRIIELQDTKSTQSLAQIYEKDYLAGQDSIVDDRDEKLKKEHEEIERQWEKVCSKLDALCNAHFVPKQPKAMISTISNVATASLESTLPTAKATTSILTPEEIFNPTLSETRSRSELTPIKKRALRTRERKAKKKQREALKRDISKMAKVSRGVGGAKREKQVALQNIIKTGKGVTAVGRQGKNLASIKKRQKV